MKSVIPIILLLSITSCFDSKRQPGCKNYKNGTFMFRFKGELDGVTFLIQRKDSIQIETNKKAGTFTKLSVKWTSDCTYETRLIESNMPFPDSIQEMRKKVPLKVEIVKCASDYYVFRAKRDNDDYVMIDTLFVEK